MTTENLLIKIDPKYLVEINNENINKYFGEWIYNTSNLNEKFVSGQPYENIVIDNFFKVVIFIRFFV